MRRIASACLCLLSLAACDNALYYYDKANLALSVEGRPDPTGPVQVAIAYKQRTVVVAPPRVKTPSPTPTSGQTSATPQQGESQQSGESQQKVENDAVAMIGSFHASHSGAFGKTVIRTAFLTGDAAIFNDPFMAQSAADALSGATALPTAADNAKHLIEAAKAKSLCPQVSAIFSQNRSFAQFDKFTLAEQATLKQINYFPEVHNEPLFRSMQQQIGECR